MKLADANILIVDDEPILRMTFSLLLRQYGAAVRVAANGAEALNALQSESVDILLTDKQMPVMDGITLLRTMLENQIRVPTLFFANGTEDEDRDEMHRLNVVQMLTKPIHPETLMAFVSDVLKDLPDR